MNNESCNDLLEVEVRKLPLFERALGEAHRLPLSPFMTLARGRDPLCKPGGLFFLPSTT